MAYRVIRMVDGWGKLARPESHAPFRPEGDEETRDFEVAVYALAKRVGKYAASFTRLRGAGRETEEIHRPVYVLVSGRDKRTGYGVNLYTKSTMDVYYGEPRTVLHARRILSVDQHGDVVMERSGGIVDVGNLYRGIDERVVNNVLESRFS